MEKREKIKIPLYTPCVKISAEKYEVKAKGNYIDYKINIIMLEEQNLKWAEKVESIYEALNFLPDEVTKYCTKAKILATLLKDATKIKENHSLELKQKAEEIENKISRSSEPIVILPNDEKGWFDDGFCKKAEKICEERISWCEMIMDYEEEYYKVQESIRSLIQNETSFQHAKEVYRIARLDKEVFALTNDVLTSYNYTWLSKISLVEKKFKLLTDQERINSFSIKLIEKLIEVFLTCVTIENKMRKDSVYGLKVFKAQKNCQHKKIPFLKSSIYKHIKKPAVESVLDNINKRQCEF